MGSFTPLQHEPHSLQELKDSYDRLFNGWMGEHKNIDQANKILDLLKVTPGEWVADIGCGLGYVLDIAAGRGLNAAGIDLSTTALTKARSNNQHPPRLVQGSAENLPWASHSFDHVIILGSLEHFLDPGQAVRETARILKPGGKAAILVPNSHHIRAIYNVYKYGEILPDLQDFERFATRLEWERLFDENGLRVQSVAKYDSGMARVHKKGREAFWYLYNVLFRLFGNWWIPLNFTYTFIFICTPKD